MLRCTAVMLMGLLALGASACSGGEKSVSLLFPNEAARQAVQRIVVEAHKPGTDAVGAGNRTCVNDFLGFAANGRTPVGSPVRGDYVYPFEVEVLAKVPSGPQIVYVLGYASREDDAVPVLEGCTDRFDSKGGGDVSQEVVIELAPVIPETARLSKLAGDRQVGRAGEALAVPLTIRVEAEAPSSGATYVIPGVSVTFEVLDSGFSLVSSDGRLDTDTQGEARVDMQLPGATGSGRVRVQSTQIEKAIDCEALCQDTGVECSDACEARWKQEFVVSVTEAVSFPTTEAVHLGTGVPIEVAIGQLRSGGGQDVVVLSCAGEGSACRPGLAAVSPSGQTMLTVISGLGAGGGSVTPVVPPPGGLGVLPAALVVEDLLPPLGVDDIAVLNSRRQDCAARRCEGSELMLFQAGPTSIDLDHRATLTASNAVGMTPYLSNGESYLNLAVVGQGRSVNTRPCSRVNPCLPVDAPYCADNPAECGCPAGEQCECPECPNTTDPGVCVARDKIVDLMVNRWNTRAISSEPCSPGQPKGRCPDNEVCQGGRCVPRAYFNDGGCQEPVVECDNNDPDSSTCECADAFRGNSCLGRDACNCKIPHRINVGGGGAPSIPLGIAAGALRNPATWDIVVPSIAGLELIKAQGTTGVFGWVDTPVVNVPIHRAVIADLDPLNRLDGPNGMDVVWASREPCLEGINYQRACSIWLGAQEGLGVGCLGVYYSEGEDDIFDLRPPEQGGCRRYRLSYVPDGLCVGKFNGDDSLDVAVASRELGAVAVATGDGRGGLLNPPELIDPIYLPLRYIV